MATRNLIGIDIGTKLIKAVQMTEQNKELAITEYAQVEVQSQESIPDAIKDILSQKNFATKRVVTSVSGRFVIVRYISMSNMGEEEMRNAAKYELGKYIPFEVDEVLHDCQKLSAPAAEGAAAEEMRVLLVAAKRTFIDEHTALIESAGLIPTIIDVDSFALGNADEMVGTVNPEAASADKIVALVDIGATKTNINIMNGTTSFFTREFYKGGDDITDAISKKLSLEVKEAEMMKRSPGGEVHKVTESISGVIDDICQDVNISIDFFENQYDKKVEDVLLTGGSSNAVGIPEAIERTTGKKVLKWNAADYIKQDLDRLSKEELERNASVATIAIGLASRIR
ncbi:MAG: hypothetical protein A2Z34_10780 [Planctomycetes bacterium RBG_16_59_8]|nr:MAG: hypothetical protein A2Z34_10780 [Planctomycetes bacterium RBG_16_59_8]